MIIAKLQASLSDPNSTMFGMPNLGELSSAVSEAKHDKHSPPRPLKGPGMYQLKRRTTHKPVVATTHSPAQRDDLWADLDSALDGAQPARKRQTHTLLHMLLDDDTSPQPNALGELEVPPALITRRAQDSLEGVIVELTDEPLTEVELFGRDFPGPKLEPLTHAHESKRKPEYNTNAPACTHSTNPGLEERTAAAHKRYFLVCEEDGKERRVLLDAKLVELVTQLIFEPVR